MRRADDAAAGLAAGDAFPTGFPSIDKVLGGGVRRGDLIVVGGDVGCGKSSLALGMALRMSQRSIRTALYTHEMSVERLLERALAIESRCRIDDLRSGALDEMTRSAVGAVALRLREATPHLETLGAGGVDALGDALRRREEADVAFVDSLQSLAFGVRPNAEDLATAVHALKRIALDLNLALVILSHLESRPERRTDLRPTLDDFGALGAVKQDADVVFGIYREEMYHPGDGVEGATELRVLKNRNGSSGYVDLYFYKQWLRFEDLLDPEPR